MAIHEGKPESVKHNMSSYPVGLGTLILARASIFISSVYVRSMKALSLLLAIAKYG